MSYLPDEIRRWVREYDDSKTRVRLTNLADRIEDLESGIDERVTAALSVIDGYDLETNESLQAALAADLRHVLVPEED